MDDSGGNYADETIEMLSENAANVSTELRKRRSTRIVQAVPLVVTGVDALGRPFVERTSSLIINCHGCRYQSKHYVLKNMWVTLEIPHPETGQPPRTVRGRVAWIQRPRTVRQLFQVALELEISGNAWGIAFPPEDWFAFPDNAPVPPKPEAAPEAPELPPPSPDSEVTVSLNEPETPATAGPDNVRVFPSPASTTDASLQLARQVARLVADAKQQIQAATREAASQAVSAERRLSFEQWEQKFAAARAEISNDTERAIEKLQHDADEHSRTLHAAAAEALRTELPRWLAPQLEQLTRDLTAKLSEEAAARRDELAQRAQSSSAALQSACQLAEEAAVRLKTQSEQLESQIAGRAEASVQALTDAARQREEAAAAQHDARTTAARQAQEEMAASLTAAQASWQGRIENELEAAQARWQQTIEGTFAEAQDRVAGSLNEHARGLITQLQEEMGRHTAAMRDSAAGLTAESEHRLAALLQALQEHAQRLETALSRAAESTEKLDRFPERIENAQQQALQTHAQRLEAALSRATESAGKLEHFSERIENAQHQALGAFQSQLDDVLSLHRNELHRGSESALGEINNRIRALFEDSVRQSLEQFQRQVQETLQPHVAQTEEAIQRLAGGRSLLDAALTLQQDRIRNSADEAFAESLARFRENLGGVEQILQESAQTITDRNLAELEGKVSELKHQVIEELFKSAEWYEKKAQTQIQNQTERAIEQTANQLREKAGEISGVFASELDHSSRNFVGHTQTQMEEIVRESFERARALFAEAADTTAAAFTDEVQRTGRHELDGFSQEAGRVLEELRAGMNTVRAELAERVTAEQEEFLRRFQAAVGGTVETEVAEVQKRVQEGFGPLLEAWKSMTESHQQEMAKTYKQMGEHAAEHYKNRLENVSNQWMLATVASLDHQSRDLIAGIAANAEEKLRQTCALVFAGIGESMRERLKEIASSFKLSAEAAPRAKSANTSI
jgi:hypothetical protein